MPIKKSRLGLLNPVTAVKEKYLSSQRASAELICALTEGGALYNADHLLAPRQERRDGQENRDGANDTILKGLVGDIKCTDQRPTLRAKNTGAWLNTRGTMVIVTVLLAT